VGFTFARQQDGPIIDGTAGAAWNPGWIDRGLRFSDGRWKISASDSIRYTAGFRMPAGIGMNSRHLTLW
jgi:hypothetical protein